MHPGCHFLPRSMLLIVAPSAPIGATRRPTSRSPGPATLAPSSGPAGVEARNIHRGCDLVVAAFLNLISVRIVTLVGTNRGGRNTRNKLGGIVRGQLVARKTGLPYWRPLRHGNAVAWTNLVRLRCGARCMPLSIAGLWCGMHLLELVLNQVGRSRSEHGVGGSLKFVGGRTRLSDDICPFV